MSSSVRVRRTSITYPTFAPFPPQKNPMFLEHRVYQGSSGRVYPLPVIDRVEEAPSDRAWDAVYIENEFLEVLILPAIGGRIHAVRDKTNDYDLIYRQDAIKPALVGLAGPWLSGGIEFNWPQHHRPSTYMPADVEIEEGSDGSKTVWLSEHDPMLRMKGMHGICLHPGRAVLELRARAYNRTSFPQTFLWWANVATQVHEGYRSFFPPDVHYIADHAKRAMSAYPLCEGRYYGVDYGTRGRKGVPASEQPRQFVPLTADAAARINRKRNQAERSPGPSIPAGVPTYAPNDLSWYANIPVPTSYMAMGSREDFFGGYDYFRQAGLVHVANHHISPGKKQWTWGNQEFGYAWDRNLTTPDKNGVYPPYIEIMAGVYTDNQPDFSFLQPGETKTWSQFWYPIRDIGPAQHANAEAAVSLAPDGRKLRVGIGVTRPHAAVRLTIEAPNRTLIDTTIAIAPDRPYVTSPQLPRGVALKDISVVLAKCDATSSAEGAKAVRLSRQHETLTPSATGRTARQSDGRSILIRYQPAEPVKPDVPPPATEPAAPEAMASADELYLTGLHLEQYRHATRKPELYWREALRRDPGDARCNHALGAWHLRRGEFELAERHLRAAIARLTERNPNPVDNEPYYTLGLCLRYQAEISPKDAATSPNAGDRWADAYAAFYKATWDHAWQAAGYHALAEIDCRREEWAIALDHLDRALRVNTDNLRARDLKAMVLRKLGRGAEARAWLQATLALDPLDWWARYLIAGDEPAATSTDERAQPAPAPSFACDAQTRLDLAHDFARAGFFRDALAVLESAPREAHSGTGPLIGYTAAWLCDRLDDERRKQAWLKRAAAASPDYCFPARLEELIILRWAAAENGRDARAPFYLGNLLYDRRRYDEAIAYWERSARLEPHYSVVWRNLGLAYFNVRQQVARARTAYEKAFRCDPHDARLLFERDQLWKRIGIAPRKRLRELEAHPALVRQRDDLAIELCALYNLTGQPEKALRLLTTRNFQPWEGGEGQALGQYVRTHLALGRAALKRGDPAEAQRLFSAALNPPQNLGEALHPLANQSDVHFWLGEACAAAGHLGAARKHWTAAATFTGDFQAMSVRAFSEMTYFSALAWSRLGRKAKGRTLLRGLLAYARQLEKAEAKIDYFATSLPTMLLFNDDLSARQRTAALLLQAQAHLGLGATATARRLLRDVVRRDPALALPSGIANLL